ncbi:MAG TPA: SurA N-terminal domain-containing protein [Candidatus Paceibacterota bacterium]
MREKIKHIAREHKFKLILAALVLAAILGIGLVSLNRYPIITVNGSPVSANRFWRNYQGALKYYENARKNLPAEQAPTSTPSGIEMQAEILTQMVEAELISQGAQKEIGKDLDFLVQNKISRYENNQSLAQAANTLYGMTYKEFQDEVMVPQAEKEILAGRFYMSGDNFEEWFAKLKKDASVNIFSKGFRWDGERVRPN